MFFGDKDFHRGGIFSWTRPEADAVILELSPCAGVAGLTPARFWSRNNGRGSSADPALILAQPLPARRRIKTHPGAV